MRNDNLTQLRELLYEDPSREVWTAIMEALEESATDGDRHMAIQYIEAHLDGWPDELRVAPRSWWEARLDGQTVEGWDLVRCLDLSDALYRDERAKKFLRSKHMRSLSALLLRDASLTPQGLYGLTVNKHLGHLTTLDISNNPLRTVRGIASLVETENLFDLKVLRIRNNDLKSNAIAELVNAPVVERLAELDVSGNRLLIAGTRALVASPKLQHLVTLHVEDSGMSDKTAPLFARASNMPELRRLFIGGNALGPGGLQPLASGPLLAQLEHLDVSHNGLGPNDVDALLDKAASNLVTLGFARNTVGDAGSERLARNEQLGALRRLDLRGNRITTLGAHALARASWLRSLDRLDLRGNPIEPDGIAALREALGARAARVLRIDEAHGAQRSFDAAEAHARLRGLTRQAPSAEAWDAVTTALEAFPEGRDLEVALEEALVATATWPAELTELPNAWWTRLRKGLPQPRARLARQLTIQGHGDDAVMAGLLKHGGELTNLARLRIVDVPLTEGMCLAMARAHALARLRELDLDGCALDAAALDALATLPALPGLRRLRLNRNRLSARPLGTILAKLERVEELELTDVLLDADGVKAVWSAPLPELRRLDLSGSALDLSQLPSTPAPRPHLEHLRWVPNSPHLAAPLVTPDRLTPWLGPALSSLALDGRAWPELIARSSLGTLQALELHAPIVLPSALSALSRLERLTLRDHGDVSNLSSRLATALAKGDLPGLQRLEITASDGSITSKAFFKLLEAAEARGALIIELPEIALHPSDVQRVKKLRAVCMEALAVSLDASRPWAQVQSDSEEVLQSPALRDLKSFSIHNFGPRARGRRGRCPMKEVRHLHLGGNTADIDAWLSATVGRGDLDALESLSLELNYWGNINFVNNISRLRRLTRFTVETSHGAHALTPYLVNAFSTGEPPPWQEVTLRGVSLGVPLVDVLARAPRLRTLSLRGSEIDDAVIERLATAPGFRHLQRLDLTGCRLTAKHAQMILTSTTLRNLAELVMEDVPGWREVWWEGNVRRVTLSEAR